MATAVVYFWSGINFSLQNFIVMALIVYAVIFLETIIHELGHLVTASLVGFRFHFFMVGFLTVFRRNGQLLAAFERLPEASGAGAAGFVPYGADNLEIRTRLVALGGPIGSALLSLLGLLLVLNVSSDGLLAFTAGMLAAYPLISIMFNLPPYQSGGYTSDGAIVFMTDAGRAVIDRNQIVAQSARGKRPRDWLYEGIQKLLSLHQPTAVQAAGHLYAAYHALDHADLETVRHHLTQALTRQDDVVGQLYAQIKLEAAYITAQYDNDKQLARSHFEAGCEASLLVDRSILCRAQAAVLLAEGDLEGGRAALECARLSLETSLDKGLAVAEQDWLNSIGY